MSKIDPSTLVGQPLRLRRTAAGDYSVVIGDLPAGRIMRKPVAGGSEVWLWTVTGPYLPPGLQPAAGDAQTLDEAKAAFRAKYDAWLQWALAQGCEAVWHTGAHRSEI